MHERKQCCLLLFFPVCFRSPFSNSLEMRERGEERKLRDSLIHMHTYNDSRTQFIVNREWPSKQPPPPPSLIEDSKITGSGAMYTRQICDATITECNLLIVHRLQRQP